MKPTIDMIEEPYRKKVIPDLRPGNQVRIVLKIVEGESERLQTFEGTVIRLRGHGLSRTITVRKISYGVGVERILPLHSPRIEKIELLRPGHVRRARLYYLRKLSGKAARLEEKVEHREAASPGKSASASAPPPLSTAPARP